MEMVIAISSLGAGGGGMNREQGYEILTYMSHKLTVRILEKYFVNAVSLVQISHFTKRKVSEGYYRKH